VASARLLQHYRDLRKEADEAVAKLSHSRLMWICGWLFGDGTVQLVRGRSKQIRFYANPSPDSDGDTLQWIKEILGIERKIVDQPNTKIHYMDVNSDLLYDRFHSIVTCWSDCQDWEQFLCAWICADGAIPEGGRSASLWSIDKRMMEMARDKVGGSYRVYPPKIKVSKKTGKTFNQREMHYLYWSVKRDRHLFTMMMTSVWQHRKVERAYHSV